MTDDHRVPVGAVAPTGRRLVRSLLTRDVLWVVVAGLLLIATALFSLQEFRRDPVTTRDGGLRIFAVVVPTLAIIVALVAARRRSDVLAAMAVGMIVPSTALVGLVSAGYFLSRVAPYADLGVAVGIVVATFGIATIGRWFVYHPVSIVTNEDRPIAELAWVVCGLAVVLGVLQVVTAFTSDADDEGRFVGLGDELLQGGVQLFFALLFVVTAIVGAVVRTRLSFVLVAAGAFTQLAAVFGAQRDGSKIGLASVVTLWIDVAGLAVLALVGVIAVLGTQRLRADEPRGLDSESWRWTPTD